MSMPTRRIAAPTFAILAALALLGALVTGYCSHALFDSTEFADRATAALGDDAVRAEIATRVTDDLVLNADADLVAVRPVIESVVDGLVDGSVFQSVFRSGVRDVHRAVFEGDENTVTLTLVDIGTVLRGALEALQPKIAKQIPGGVEIDVGEIQPPSWLVGLVRLASDIAALELILLVACVGLAAAAMLVSAERRRTAMQFGLAIVIGAVAVAVALGVVKALLLVKLDEPGIRAAASAIWDAFAADLVTTLLLCAGGGAVIAAAASSLLRPVDIGAPLRRAASLVATVPEGRGLRALRGIALVVAGVLVIVERGAVVDALVILAGLYIAYAGVSELMRLLLPATVDDAAAERSRGKRALLATAVAAAVIFVAGTVFVAGGGLEESPAAIPSKGCNGNQALCDRPLDQVAFAATHNAMSAATNPNYLFAQQEQGFPDQLNDGIRGLLIDAHYGTPTEDGTIKTDLSGFEGGERKALVDELGEDAVDAALRIRDRIVHSPATGPRRVYLCHGFCELGAVPIEQAFKQYRDFLAANPNEVLVVVIEDYVTPAEIEKATDASGLIDAVYTGPLDPLPTLQQMIDSGGRVVMLAENQDGGEAIPWYHAAYDGLVQETPYSFHKPGELTDPSQLAKSCAPNRGTADAPLFLINHWIDTSPAPKPSNAAKVNAHDALLKRIETCERLRGLAANLIAVDFYRQGDLFGVVDQLNARPPPAAAN